MTPDADRVAREVVVFRRWCTTPKPGDLLAPAWTQWPSMIATCLRVAADEDVDDATLGAIARALLAEHDRLIDEGGR